jgi:hypothetical protein
MSITPAAPPKQVRWTHSDNLNEKEYAELLALLNRADVNPYTPNSKGGWGWQRGLTAHECDLIFRAWGNLFWIYENQFEEA